MNIATRCDFGLLLAERGLLEAAAEIGVASGDYALTILRWGVKKLYLVDLWQHVPDVKGSLGLPQDAHDSAYEATVDRLAEYRDRVVVLRGWSHEQCERVPDGSLGFCHIDATHEYDEVLRDLHCWWPKLLPRGIMSGHDYLSTDYTVKPAADEFAALHGCELKVTDADRPEHACFWFEKP